MNKKEAIIFIGICCASLGNAAPTTPLEEFIADGEFCAYMVALPENDSAEFLKRYEAAMRGAISFIRDKNKDMTETQALFSIKTQCDVALNSILRDK